MAAEKDTNIFKRILMSGFNRSLHVGTTCALHRL